MVVDFGVFVYQRFSPSLSFSLAPSAPQVLLFQPPHLLSLLLLAVVVVMMVMVLGGKRGGGGVRFCLRDALHSSLGWASSPPVLGNVDCVVAAGSVPLRVAVVCMVPV